MQLQPCEGCRRHVAVGSTSCPFCAAPLGEGKSARDPISRLSRAAVFVAATTVAATTVGCWTNKAEPKHVEQQHVQAATPDAGIADAPIANQLPDPDEDRRNYQNHPCVDTPQGPMCAPYGAPPARRRIV